MNTKGERAKPMKTGHESRIKAGLDLVVSLPDTLNCQDKLPDTHENTPISRAEDGVKVKTGKGRARLLSDLRAVRAHHAFTRDRIGQPGCEVRLVAAEYVETIDAAIEALTPAPQGAA